MHCVKKIQDDLYWVGASDRRLALFENVYPIPEGVSYNAYVLLDEKTVLLDTVDQSVSRQFFENLEFVLNGRPLDYIIVDHMEPDHAATLQETVRRHPEARVVCNVKTVTMIHNFFTFDVDARAVVVKELDTLCTGRHTFTFLMAPMVHWPEVMVSYESTEKVLFSAAMTLRPKRSSPPTRSARSGRWAAICLPTRSISSPKSSPRRGGITRTSSANTARRCRRC